MLTFGKSPGEFKFFSRLPSCRQLLPEEKWWAGRPLLAVLCRSWLQSVLVKSDAIGGQNQCK
jgi:hypothetical protein